MKIRAFVTANEAEPIAADGELYKSAYLIYIIINTRKIENTKL